MQGSYVELGLIPNVEPFPLFQINRLFKQAVYLKFLTYLAFTGCQENDRFGTCGRAVGRKGGWTESETDLED